MPPVYKGAVWLYNEIDWTEVKEGLIQFTVLMGVFAFTMGKEAAILWRRAEQALVYRSPDQKVSIQPVEKVIPQPTVKVSIPPVQKLLPPAKETVTHPPTVKVNQQPVKKTYSVKELKVLAKKAGHKNYSKLNKQALMNLVGV